MGRILITGGSKGIGYACAQRLALAGASVVLAAREAEPLEIALANLPQGDHKVVQLDVGSQDSWTEARNEIGEVEGLVHAAGVLGPIGPLDEIDVDELEATIRTNLFGTFLAVRECLPSVRKADGTMVVFSGGGATSPLPRYDTYAASKAGVVRLVENLAEDGVRINAVAPGFVATDIHQGTLEAGPEKSGTEYFEKTSSELEGGGVPPERAAKLVAFLMSETGWEISGRLLSAQWDPWEEDDFAASIAHDPDFGRLRRVDRQSYFASE